MKQTLLIFSLLLTMVASCQVKKDSTLVGVPSNLFDSCDDYWGLTDTIDRLGFRTTYATDLSSGYVTIVDVSIADTIIKTYDTIKVMMLICDTSFIDGYSYTQAEYDSSNNPKHYLYIENRFPSVLWVFGYEVRKVEKRNNVDGRIDPYAEFGFKYQEWDVYYHNEYLDIDKKQLPQYFIVWQTKQ